MLDELGQCLADQGDLTFLGAASSYYGYAAQRTAGSTGRAGVR